MKGRAVKKMEKRKVKRMEKRLNMMDKRQM